MTALLECGVKADAMLLLEDNCMIRRVGNGSGYLLMVLVCLLCCLKGEGIKAYDVLGRV